MVIYLATLALSVLFARQLQRANGMQAPRKSNGWTSRFWLLLLLLLLGCVAGLRKFVGTDYGNYIDIYSLAKGKSYTAIWGEKESLFGFLNRFCADVFDSYIPVFVIAAMVTVALILYGIYQSSSEYWLSIFLLITGMYYFDLFNGMRQMIATAIMFAGYPLIKRRKWLGLILLTIVAYGFHASAVIVLAAFIYAAKVRPGSPVMWLTVAAFAAIYFSYNAFIENLVNVLNQTGSVYTNYENMLVQQGQGANILRFGLAAVPGALGLYSWKQLRCQRRDAGILLNLSIISALFMLIATRHWIFARLCMFLGIYNILLWPEILKCFEPKSRRVMGWGIVAVYFAYFWLIVHTDSNLLPYQSWMFGGVYY